MTQPPRDASGFLPEEDALDALREGPGTLIGPYKLVRQIGEGGFGVVFMAEQEKPVARRVALKIIKLGMDTHQVVARFEQERQALAIMDHPNIARVIDAGATQTGRPYFVMDYVEGAPIGEYCDKQRLSIDERLALFEQVCAAVQHAHTKGIIHRDIKPSNVLIATLDGRAQPKVIDFGIAKATSAKLSEKTVYTEDQQVIGTLQYMSPEQAEGSLDIDTRTDVYSLGVLLYELLTGSTPFDVKALRSAIFSDIQRMIRELDPPKPSTRLRESAAALVDIAARRRTEPARIGSQLRGELDWIAMKALEKERARRYETADALGLDVRRYLAGEAVAAAPPSKLYQLRKLARRHRAGVTAAAAVAAALLIGLIAFAWQARVAREQRDIARKAELAESEQRKAADQQRELADAQRDRALRAEAQTSQRAAELELVSHFQDAMLAQVDLAAAGRFLTQDITAKMSAALAQADASEQERAAQLETFGQLWRRVNATDAARDLIDRTILQPASAAIDKQFADQPLIAAQLRQTLATRYKGLGLYDAALPLQESALATRRQLLGDDHIDTLHSLNDYGDLQQLRGRLPEAEQLLSEALERFSRAFGPEFPDTITSLANVGMVLGLQGRLDEAEPYYREAVELSRRVLGPEHETTLTALSNWGNFLRERNQLAQAEPVLREAHELSRRARGAESLLTLYSANSLGFVLVMQGKLDEGAQYWRETLEVARRALGEDHPDTLVFLANMAGLLIDLRRPAEAEPYYREALEKFQRLLGPDHPNSIQSLANLGVACSQQHKMDEAEPLLREALERSTRVLGAEHPQTLRRRQELAHALRIHGRGAEADALAR